MQGKGARRRRVDESGAEAVLDELYITPPSDFVSRREERAAAAKADGRADDVRLIRGARRPTLAAWAANLLLRSRPEESRQFLELGQALREAYGTLDPAGLKRLSDQRRRVVAALSQQAAELARDAGHPLSDSVQQEVTSTLRAVLADPDSAGRWAAGRLETALTPPSDFPSGTGSAAAATHGTKPTPSPSPKPPARAKDELAERRRERQQRLAAAREAAETAARRLRDRRAEKAKADERWQRARDRHGQVRQRVSTAEQQLRQAREELEQADQEQQRAEEGRRTAADTVARAEREAHETAQEAERLSSARGT